MDAEQFGRHQALIANAEAQRVADRARDLDLAEQRVAHASSRYF